MRQVRAVRWPRAGGAGSSTAPRRSRHAPSVPAREPARRPVEAACPAGRPGQLTDVREGSGTAASGRLMTQRAVPKSGRRVNPSSCLASPSRLAGRHSFTAQASPTLACCPFPRLGDQAPTRIAANFELPIPVQDGPREPQRRTDGRLRPLWSLRNPVRPAVLPTPSARWQMNSGFACVEAWPTPVPGAEASAASRPTPGPAIAADGRAPFSRRRSSSTVRRHR